MTKPRCAAACGWLISKGNEFRTAIAQPRWFINAEPDWVLLEEVPIEELMAKDGTLRLQPYSDVDCVASGPDGDASRGMALRSCVSK